MKKYLFVLGILLSLGSITTMHAQDNIHEFTISMELDGKVLKMDCESGCDWGKMNINLKEEPEVFTQKKKLKEDEDHKEEYGYQKSKEKDKDKEKDKGKKKGKKDKDDDDDDDDEDDEDESSEDITGPEDLDGFMIQVHLEGETLHFMSYRGTSWKILSYTVSEEHEIVLNESGIRGKM